MKNKKSLFDVASTVGNDALLQVAEQQPAAATTRAVRTKTLKAIPETFFAAHKKLRDTNKTNLDFSNYIMEALREKLERDGAI
ncbi:chaperonin [Yersinia ruckeri]|uniref:chaperonin n=1 Tax=Yersinia ruckeri TaxID=29486 RepID=UPI001F2FE23F|nr:chaperonin [Yersinia ruckeri]UIN02625.1 chaperonin [Yersinia ruckeri]